MSVRTSLLWVLALLSALSSVSGTEGGLKWGPQREKEHLIYVAATNDPCILTGWSENDEQWQLVGERETSGRATPDNLCKSALKSFKEIHWSEQADCVNPIGAKCNKDQKCVLTVPGSSNHCYGRKPCTVHFTKCAKTVIDTHKKFLEKEKKLLEDTNAPKLKGPCNCPHCRRCPMRIYGCPFCPHFPKEVDRLEMQGEDNYPKFRKQMEKMKFPCEVPKPTSQLRRPASEPPLNNQPVFPYFTGGPIPGPTSLSKTYSTQSRATIKGKQILQTSYSTPGTKYKYGSNYASSSTPYS